VTQYDFRFVVEGASVDNVEVVELLEVELDAMLARGGGVDLIDIAYEGLGAVDAALNAVQAVHRLVPTMKMIRLDRDLVGVPEIAERAGVSRQNVHQWSTGARRNGEPFPKPEGVAGRSHVWLWTEVNEWLKSPGYDDGLTWPTRYEMSEIDCALHSGLASIAEPALRRWLDLRHQSTGMPSELLIGGLADSTLSDVRSNSYFTFLAGWSKVRASAFSSAWVQPDSNASTAVVTELVK
jgi:predicted DNA-binding transcriptional regulator AlpA